MKNKCKFKVGDEVILLNHPDTIGTIESVSLSILGKVLIYSYDIKIGEKLYVNTIEKNLKRI